MSGYEPRWDIDLAFGEEAERSVEDIIRSIQTGRTEVKRDAQWKRTGNLYVEYACRTAAGWSDSGIATSEADHWAFVIGEPEVVVMLPTDVLRDFARNQWPHNKASETDGSHPTKGVLVNTNRLWAWLRVRSNYRTDDGTGHGRPGVD